MYDALTSSHRARGGECYRPPRPRPRSATWALRPASRAKMASSENLASPASRCRAIIMPHSTTYHIWIASAPSPANRQSLGKVEKSGEPFTKFFLSSSCFDEHTQKLVHVIEPGTMERAVTASNLMSLGSAQILSITIRDLRFGEDVLQLGIDMDNHVSLANRHADKGSNCYYKAHV